MEIATARRATSLPTVVAAAFVLLAAAPASAHWFGFAFNAYGGAQSPSRFRPRVSGTQVSGQLRCRRPASGACIGRVGRIAGELRSQGAGGLEEFVGTLTYAQARATCQLRCDVSVQGPPVPRPPGPRSFWACIYDGCTAGRVAVGTFTTQRF